MEWRFYRDFVSEEGKVIYGGSAKINPGLPRRLALNAEVIFGGTLSLIRITADAKFSHRIR